VGGGSAQVLRLDPATGHASPVGKLPEPIADAAAVDLGCRLVVVGGGTRGVFDIDFSSGSR